jgi:hypothetical protein
MELPLAAPVLGEEVRTSDAEVMQEIVLTRLLDRYAEERQAAGDVKIHEKALEDACWRYFTDERLHSFCRPGSKEEAQAFATPPWERKAAAE